MACTRIAGADRAMAMESRPRRRWLQDRGFESRRRQTICGRAALGIRSVAVGQPFGRAVKNPGILGAPGDAARQSPAAMARARLRANAQPSETKARLSKF